jgi:hypothetical protein
MEQLLGPLPPQLLRGAGRPGLGHSAARNCAPPEPAPAAERQGAAAARLAGLGEAQGLRDGGVNKRPLLQPRKVHVEGWHEKLSPLGMELAKVSAPEPKPPFTCFAQSTTNEWKPAVSRSAHVHGAQAGSG